MKLSEMIWANAAALAAAIIWILCAVIVSLLPDFSTQVLQWIMHGMTLPARNLTLSNFFLGGISFIVISWVCGWIFGWSLKKVSGK